MLLPLLLILNAATVESSVTNKSGVNLASASGKARVHTPADLIAAISDPAVHLIDVGADMVLTPGVWPASVILIGRNLTIQSAPGAPERFLNFATSVGVVSMARGVHLLFLNLMMTGLSVGNYFNFIVDSPGAFLWQRGGAWKAPVCPSINKMVTIMTTLPRPASAPGHQTAHPMTWPYCIHRTCYTHRFYVVDGITGAHISVIQRDAAPLGTHMSLKYDVVWLCDVAFSDACVAQRGYEACRVEMLAQHTRGVRHSYDSRWLTAFSVATALACVLATAVATWAVTRTRPDTARSAAKLPTPVECSSLSAPGHISTSRLAPSSSRPGHTLPTRGDESSGQGGNGSGRQQGAFNPRSHFVAKGSRDNVELGPFIAAGSYGRVYQGWWDGRTVAVKIIVHDRQAAGRIAKEAALSLALDHPNIVRTFHHFSFVEDEAAVAAAAKSAKQSAQSTAYGTGSSAQSTTAASEQRCTWLVQELCDWGPLSAHLTHHMTTSVDGSIDHTRAWAAHVGCGSRTGCGTGGQRWWQRVRGRMPAAWPSRRLQRLLRREGAGAVSVGPALCRHMARTAEGLVLGYAADIARGMAYLHAHNVCHGDLKAANTLVVSGGPPALSAAASGDGPGVVKVADFGLSREMAADQSHLSTLSFGTITHMPPELLLDGKLTRECDVYSFGITMWELVTCEMLYTNLNPVQVINKVLTQRARPTFPAHVDEDFVGLANACWAHEARTRPTFAQIVSRLEALIKARRAAARGATM